MLNKEFISEIDLFLQEFDAKHAKSPAQQAEIAKYKRLNKLRDKTKKSADEKAIWEEF